MALSVFLVMNLSIAADQPKYGGKLVVGQDIDAVGLDPYKTTAFASWNYFELIYNSLLRFDNQGALQPELAVSWDNPDPLTYTFRLRQGVKWHDGKEFEAADVKATFDRIMDEKTASFRRVTFKLLDKTEVVDKYTVRFKLQKPFAPFLGYLGSKAHSAILSKKIIDTADPNQVVVGTGPFQMVAYTPNDKMLLKRNPDFWEKGLPYLDEIEIRLVKDASSRVAGLRSQSLDYTWLIEPQMSKILLKDPKINSGKAPPTGRLRLYFNCTKPPFDNQKVRQALSLATDRNEVIKISVMGNASLSGPIPPSAGDFAYPPEKLSFYGYNPDQAKKLLSEAGYPNGLKATAKVSAAHIIDQYAVQIIQRQWKKVGVDIEIVQEEWGSILRSANSRNYQIILITDIWRPDPDEYIVYGRDVVKRAGFSTPVLDALIEKGVTTTDRNQRIAIYHEIEQKLAEYSPILYIFARPQRFEFWQNYVKGYIPSPLCSRIGFKETWLDK
jgi:peptide/nickel transport system substrate-binding protein